MIYGSTVKKEKPGQRAYIPPCLNHSYIQLGGPIKEILDKSYQDGTFLMLDVDDAPLSKEINVPGFETIVPSHVGESRVDFMKRVFKPKDGTLYFIYQVGSPCPIAKSVIEIMDRPIVVYGKITPAQQAQIDELLENDNPRRMCCFPHL